MRIYRQLAELPTLTTPVVATIGNYDGVHLGHQGVIAEVIRRARALSGLSLAITFEPHPARVLHPERPHLFLTPLARKLELLEATGIDATLVLPFTDELRRSSARDFATRVLAGILHVTEVHEGANFRFGHQAEAGVTGPYGLQALGRELGFTVIVHPPLSLRSGTVSSSRIRALVSDGAVSQARVLLGRPFSIDSHPASGRGFGTRYAVPTVNLEPYPELLPAHGVYVTTLAVGLGPAAETFHAVTNVGIRPTFGAASFAVESHLLDFHPIPLNRQTPLRLTFLLRLRPEQRFADIETLRAQIARDVARARRFFALCNLFAWSY